MRIPTIAFGQRVKFSFAVIMLMALVSSSISSTVYAATPNYSSSGTIGGNVGKIPAGNAYNAAIGPDGNLYYTSGAVIKKYDSNNMLIGTIGSGILNSPTMIRFDSSGDLYTTDYQNKAVYKFDTSGNLLNQFGSAGTGNGEFTNPSSVAIAANGNLYVTDSGGGNDRVEVFDHSGTFLFSFASGGSGDGELSYPLDVNLDASGNVYVDDANNYRIEKFSPTGVYLSQISLALQTDSQGVYSRSVFINAANNIVVSDTNNASVKTFAQDGTLISQFSTLKSDENIYSVTTLTISQAPDNSIYVAYYGGNNPGRISVYSPSGTFIKDFTGQPIQPANIANPTSVATQSDGSVVILDSDNPDHAISRFTSAGTFINWFGQINQTNPTNQQFALPASIYVAANDHIYVSDSSTNRITELTPTGTFIRTYASGGNNPGQFNALAASSTDSTGNLYGLDVYGTINKYTASGSYIKSIGSPGTAAGQMYYPSAMWIDSHDTIYVSDPNNSRIDLFDTDGNFLSSQTATFTDDLAQQPYYAFVATDNSGNIYVSDSANGRVKIVTNQWQPLQAVEMPAGYGFSYPTSVALAGAKMYVTDTANRRVEVFTNTSAPLGGGTSGNSAPTPSNGGQNTSSSGQTTTNTTDTAASGQQSQSNTNATTEQNTPITQQTIDTDEDQPPPTQVEAENSVGAPVAKPLVGSQPTHTTKASSYSVPAITVAVVMSVVAISGSFMLMHRRGRCL